MSPLPEVVSASGIPLTNDESASLQEVYPDYQQIVVEKEFGGGYSGTRVLLVLPVDRDGRRVARYVTKLGPASELSRERNNYQRYAGRALPSCVAQVTDYSEHADRAALNYVFVGGGSVGRSLSLEDYYATRPASDINQTLSNVLDKDLGQIWYAQSRPLNCLFRDEYGQHLPLADELERIVKSIFPDLKLGDEQIQIRGVDGTYPHPLKVYPRLLNQTLEGRRSFVHGDFHLRNVLVDEAGKGWLIDFAKVKERHNLFDFIKFEIYVRLMPLAAEHGAFSLKDYARFEEALNDATLGRQAAPPTDPHLAKAYAVIQAIRQIAQNYLGDRRNFKKEYLSALFLYGLSMLKYYPSNGAAPTQLIFLTTCALGQCLLTSDQPMDVTRPAVPPISSTAEQPAMPMAQPRETHEARETREVREPRASVQSDNITVGNITGSTGVAIGRGARDRHQYWQPVDRRDCQSLCGDHAENKRPTGRPEQNGRADGRARVGN